MRGPSELDRLRAQTEHALRQARYWRQRYMEVRGRVAYTTTMREAQALLDRMPKDNPSTTKARRGVLARESG